MSKTLHSWNIRVVETLVEALWWPAVANRTDVSAREVIDYVLAQRQRMPDYLRGPMMVLTLAFDLLPLASAAHCRFHKLPIASRQQIVVYWRSSRFGVARDFLRFYESLTVFGSASTTRATSRRTAVF